MTGNGILVPFTRRKNELKPHFLARVKITLKEIQKGHGDTNLDCIVRKKLNKKFFRVSYAKNSEVK